MIHFNLGPGKYRIEKREFTWCGAVNFITVFFFTPFLMSLAYNTASKFIVLPGVSYLDFLIGWVVVLFVMSGLFGKMYGYIIEVRKED